MDDAIKAAIMLMEADSEKISIRTSYNVHAISFSVKDLYNALLKFIPELTIEYVVDNKRQTIADSWTCSIDDSKARKDWGWKED